MKRRLNNIVLFMVLLLMCGCLNGCGGQFQQMTAVDKAGTVAKEISLTYINLYTTAENITRTGSPMQNTFMRENINPKMNDAKLAIASMDRAIAMWKDTGIDTLNAQKQQDNILKMLVDINKLFTEVPKK